MSLWWVERERAYIYGIIILWQDTRGPCDKFRGATSSTVQYYTVVYSCCCCTCHCVIMIHSFVLDMHKSFQLDSIVIRSLTIAYVVIKESNCFSIVL